MSLSFSHKVIQAMLSLHNWLIDNNSSHINFETHTQEEADIAWNAWLQIIEEAEDETRELQGNEWFFSTAKREVMVDFLREEQLKRPSYNLEMNTPFNVPVSNGPEFLLD